MAACRDSTGTPGAELLAGAHRAWQGDWHAVWAVEWAGAPVRGPLVVEIWHTADGRLRIETLEAPVAGLSSLVLIDDGEMSRLYDLRQDRAEGGQAVEAAGLPLAGDALEAMDWLFDHLAGAAVRSAGREHLESGPATRLDIHLAGGDRAALWIDEATGLPARLQLRSATWGEAAFSARSLSRAAPPPGLFAAPE
jgi:hypothetical protein